MDMPHTEIDSVGVIGSFKQHYDVILSVLSVLRGCGLTVTTPLGSEIIKEGIDFVRFRSDDPQKEDSIIQSITLHRLFKANFVYVVCPNGYIGKTTCYETGRLLQAKRPVYFSAHPCDLPIKIPNNNVISLDKLEAMILDQAFIPTWPFSSPDLAGLGELENDMANGIYRDI